MPVGLAQVMLIVLKQKKKTPSRKRLIECVNCVRVFKRALGLWKIAKKTESVTLATDRRPVGGGGRWKAGGVGVFR